MTQSSHKIIHCRMRRQMQQAKGATLSNVAVDRKKHQNASILTCAQSVKTNHQNESLWTLCEVGVSCELIEFHFKHHNSDGLSLSARIYHTSPSSPFSNWLDPWK